MRTQARQSWRSVIGTAVACAALAGCQLAPTTQQSAAGIKEPAAPSPEGGLAGGSATGRMKRLPAPPIPGPPVRLVSHDLPEPVPGFDAGFPTSALLVPRELAKTVLPDYRIEPPDILQIDAIHVVPRSPYRLRTLDTLVVSARGALPDAPIDGAFPVEPGGTINFGRPYGRVNVRGKTIDEAKLVIEKHLAEHLKDPQTAVSLGEIGAKQQISGPHLVGPDGMVTLGGYGQVSVVGLTVEQAKAAVERHLAKVLEEPEVSIDVFSYNSKVFYVVTQGAGLGDGVTRFPITGNETVLDAISLINGLSPTSSTKIWVARPGRNNQGCHQILPVNWLSITQCGDTQTNYQLMPGDRVYVAEDRLIAMDNWLGKLIAPAERIFGFIALGTSTVSELRFFHRGGQGGGGGLGGF